MSFHQYVKRHLIFVVCLLVIGYGIVAYIHMVCPERIGQPPARGVEVAFAPVYNENGSALHARLGIGYQQGLLIAESLVALCLNWILYRLVEYHNIFFGMKRGWNYFLDFGFASIIARIPTSLLGIYTLDYLYIKKGHATYDFFDFCIRIYVTGMLLWIIPFCIKFYKYKKEHTAGMNFWEKFKWDVRLNLQLMKTPFLPVKMWWKDID